MAQRLVWVCGLLALSTARAAVVWHEDFAPVRDGQPAGWRFDATRGDVSGTLDPSEPAGGRSLRLQARDAAARATWTYTDRLALKPNTAYRLSFRAMRAAVQPGGRAYVILYENGVEAAANWHVSPYLTGTQDWQPYTVAFRTRADATWGRLQCKLWGAPGYAWFTDLQLDELAPGAALEVVVRQRPAPPDDGAPLQAMWYPAQRRPDGTLHLLPGAVNPVSLFFWGRREQVAAPHLIIEAPPQVTIRGPVVCSRETIPEPVTVSPEPVVRQGVTALRWRLPLRAKELGARLRPGGPEWTAYHFIHAEVAAGCPQRFVWRWRTECAGQLGPEHELPAQLAPRAAGAGPRPPHFPLYAQHTDALRLPTTAGRQAVLDYLAYAGIEGGLSLSSHRVECHAVDQELARRGFMTWAWHWDGYNQPGGKEFPLVYDRPHQTPALMCPQAQVDRAEPWWSTLCAGYRGRLQADTATLIINFEPPYFDCCFCARCRQAFAAQAKLPLEQVAGLTPQALQEWPNDAWGRFRAWQNGQIVKHHCAAIHAVKPDVRVGLCGPAYTEWTARRGLDIRLFEPEVAFHAPMIYEVGTAYADDVRSTCEHTRAPVIPFVLLSDLVVANIFPSPAQLRQNLLATAASGGRGAVLWVGIEALDAEYLNAARQSLSEITLMAPYLQDATRWPGLELAPAAEPSRTVIVGDQRLTVSPHNTGAPTLRQWAWQSPRGRLAVLVNYDEGNDQRLDVGRATRLFGPALTETGATGVLTLRPGEAAGVVWPPKP